MVCGGVRAVGENIRRIGQDCGAGVVQADHGGVGCSNEVDECRSQPRFASVVLQVIGLHVGHDANGMTKLQKGPIALVGFDDEMVAVRPRGTGRQLGDVASDDERGLDSGL